MGIILFNLFSSTAGGVLDASPRIDLTETVHHRGCLLNCDESMPRGV